MAEPIDVAQEVKKLLDSWNEPPEDKAMERVLGVPTEPGDVAATAHVRDSGLDHDRNLARDDIDAQFRDDGGEDSGLPPVPEDDDGDPDYNALTVDQLKQHLDARDLPTSGRKDELVERLEEDDADDEE